MILVGSQRGGAGMHEIALVIRQAQDAGQGNGMAVARTRFPDTPEMVLAEAWMQAEMARTEEWWSAVERTIDGEVIRTSIARLGGTNVG